MRAIIFGDLHIEAGSKIGDPDPDYGNTRIRDAEKALQTIAAAAAGNSGAYLIFGGDLARTPRPGSLAERVVIDALRDGGPLLATIGNHDYVPVHAGTGVHVVCRALNGVCFDRPGIWDDGEDGRQLQVGFLPWTPVSRLYEQAPGDTRTQNQLATEALYDLVRGLSEKLDPKRPSLLVGHWAIGDDVGEFIQAAEPVLDVDHIEAISKFDVSAWSHYHVPGQVGERTWRVGPAMRTSFGEADITPGYLEVEWLLGGEPGPVRQRSLADDSKLQLSK